MSNQYFTNDPLLESKPKRVQFKVRGVDVELSTDAGVFSKQGLDFGTRLMIETIEMDEDALAVDLGSGYGPVTFVLSRVYPKTKWILLDVNERAVALARTNLKSDLTRMEFHISDGFSAVPDLMADVIALNPPIRAGKAVVYRLFREASEHLRPGGALWVVINKKHGAPSAKEYLNTLFTSVELRERDAGYHVFCCTK